MPIILAEKITNARYACGTNSEAVNLAHKDLLSAPDQSHLPLGVTDYVCKMFATDFLRVAAMWVPQLITDSIIQDCQKMFSQCNGSSRLNIIVILGLLRRTDAIAFLEESLEQNGDDPWLTLAAIEALEVIRGEREIGLGKLQGRWICTDNMEDSDFDLIDLMKMHSDQNPSFDADKITKFSGNISSFDANTVVSILGNFRPIQSIVYVKCEEARVFFEVVLPLVRRLADKRRIVLCSLEIETHQLSEDDFPLFMINAAETTFDLLKRFIRLEGTGSAYLENRQNSAFIYLYNTGATVEKLSPLMTSLVEGAFHGCDRSISTHVVISGVHGQPGLRNCITPSVTSRCGVSGVEWKKDVAAA